MAQGANRPARQSQHRKAPNYSHGQERDNRPRNDNGATIAYIKRILCAPNPDPTSTTETPNPDDRSAESLDQLLPPLSSSNEIDVQLYALIAVVLDLFVQTWYSRITSDRDFVASIVQIIAHCTRALEQRIRHIGLEELIFDELPESLSEHVNAVRIAHGPQATRLTTTEVRLRYHALRPHTALSPCPVDLEAAHAQQESEVAWCLLLVNRVLSSLLPPEDLQNPCLDVLVSEVLSELIFHNGICGKACEPWLLWDIVAKILRAQRSTAGSAAQMTASTSDRLNERDKLYAEAASNSGCDYSLPQRRLTAVSHAFWTVLQAIVTISFLLRSFVLAIMHASKIPARPQRASHTSRESLAAKSRSGQPTPQVQDLDDHDAIRPIVSMAIWRCISILLMLDQRMPWLSGTFSLLLWTVLHGPGQLCSTNSRLDRLLSFNIHKRLLNAKWVPSAIQAARNAIFPENVLAPARVPPTDHEVLLIKHECAAAIVNAVPGMVRDRFFASKSIDLMIQDVECELDLFGDAHLNKHLVIRAVELIVARLFPELAEHCGEAGVEAVARSG